MGMHSCACFAEVRRAVYWWVRGRTRVVDALPEAFAAVRIVAQGLGHVEQSIFVAFKLVEDVSMVPCRRFARAIR